MQPRVRASLPHAAMHTRMAPVRFTLITRSKISTSNSSSRRMIPAAFTRKCSSGIFSRSDLTAAASVTSSVVICRLGKRAHCAREAGGDDGGAGGGKRLGDSLTDAAGPAGDQGCLAFKSEHSEFANLTAAGNLPTPALSLL